MKVLPIKEYYIRSEVEKDVDSIYLFTDNANRTSGRIPVDSNSWYYKMFKNRKEDICYSLSTQALIRGLNNAYPISTMVKSGVQWNDDLFLIFTRIIDFEIKLILDNYSKFKCIKYNNEMPFGNANISQMNISAPKCWEYLNEKLLEINIINNYKNEY